MQPNFGPATFAMEGRGRRRVHRLSLPSAFVSFLSLCALPPSLLQYRELNLLSPSICRIPGEKASPRARHSSNRAEKASRFLLPLLCALVLTRTRLLFTPKRRVFTPSLDQKGCLPSSSSSSRSRPTRGDGGKTFGSVQPQPFPLRFDSLRVSENPYPQEVGTSLFLRGNGA